MWLCSVLTGCLGRRDGTRSLSVLCYAIDSCKVDGRGHRRTEGAERVAVATRAVACDGSEPCLLVPHAGVPRVHAVRSHEGSLAHGVV